MVYSFVFSIHFSRLGIANKVGVPSLLKMFDKVMKLSPKIQMFD